MDDTGGLSSTGGSLTGTTGFSTPCNSTAPDVRPTGRGGHVVGWQDHGGTRELGGRGVTGRTYDVGGVEWERVVYGGHTGYGRRVWTSEGHSSGGSRVPSGCVGSRGIRDPPVPRVTEGTIVTGLGDQWGVGRGT